MRVAFYLRCSTAEQNVDLQRDALRSLSNRHIDWHVTEYVDAGISGAKDERPALNALMTDCRRGKIDRVVVWRFNRFARSVSHLIRALEEFRSLRVEFQSYTECIDTATPTGRLLFVIIGAMAEFERQLIVERVRAGQRAAKSKGKHIGRTNGFTAEQASRITVLRVEGKSVRTIAAQTGLAKSTVHRILCASAQCADMEATQCRDSSN